MMSRIGNHVYTKDAVEAVRLYKEAFDLEEKGKPWLDNEGLVVHQDTPRKNGDLFIGVTDYSHLPKCPLCICTSCYPGRLGYYVLF